MYRGRFAPSPSGPLHLGSLLAAVASWLDARANQGTWIVRIEDIDPPREVEGADRLILESLQAHGLFWDHAVEYQSSRLEIYREHLQRLIQLGLAYPCNCSRSDIAEMGGVYDGRCSRKTTALKSGFAWRFKMPSTVEWQDAFAGPQKADSPKETADPVIWRRDGLVAYHLAAAVDDTTMKISHVIRGSDLLSSTRVQLALIDALDKPRPEYGHIPVLNGANDQKLSKQNQAEPLNNSVAEKNLSQVLALMGQRLPAELVNGPVDQQLDWAKTGWIRNSVPAVQAIRL